MVFIFFFSTICFSFDSRLDVLISHVVPSHRLRYRPAFCTGRASLGIRSEFTAACNSPICAEQHKQHRMHKGSVITGGTFIISKAIEPFDSHAIPTRADPSIQPSYGMEPWQEVTAWSSRGGMGRAMCRWWWKPISMFTSAAGRRSLLWCYSIAIQSGTIAHSSRHICEQWPYGGHSCVLFLPRFKRQYGKG